MVISSWCISAVVSTLLYEKKNTHNPGQKVGTASKLSPSPTYNVDNRVIFSLFVGRNAIFSNID